MLTLPAKSNGESIRSHTDTLLAAINCLQCQYGHYFTDEIIQAVFTACEYHDYGKVLYTFQKSVNNTQIQKPKGCSDFNIPHGYVSPAFMPVRQLEQKFGREILSLIVTAVYYHHVRSATVTPADIKAVIDTDLKVRYPDVPLSIRYFSYLLSNESLELDTWISYALILGLLNRADYYASNTDEHKLPFEIERRSENGLLSECVTSWFNKEHKPLRNIQTYAKEHSSTNIIVCASTGIGKTEAALLWNSDSKLFYTLPLRTSINVMYERIKSKYGYDEHKVALLHSDALSYLLNNADENTDTFAVHTASQLLSYPVTVCTVDQLFTFVYRCRGSEMLLATLKYSKIVIDEIQSYSPDILAKLIYGLHVITKAGGQFAIITATLPPVLLHFIEQYQIPHAEPQTYLSNDLIRHRIHIDNQLDFDYEHILKSAETKKVLIICNTVRRAIEVYNNLKDRYNYVKLLHSKFIKRHRRLLEDEIIRFNSDRTHTGIWISTQIVEASLDIDFDVLYTEMCTADSLLQRMGRCYRNRNYADSTEANVYIIINNKPRNGYGTVYECTELYDRAVDKLMLYQDQLFTESAKMQYINDVYNTDEIEGTSYCTQLKTELQKLDSLKAFMITKEEAVQSFRNIKTISVIPKTIYDCQVVEFNQCVKVLSKKSSYAEKVEARKFLSDNSIDLSVYYDKRSRQCDESQLDDVGYHLLNYVYDFDETELSGQGLCYEMNA